MKVFGIGLGKTGTTSLTAALRILGFTNVHYPESLQQIAVADAAVGTPVYLWLDTLDRLYPGAKFIWTVRNENSWLASCALQYGPANDLSRYDERVRAMLLKLRRDIFGAEWFDEALWRRALSRQRDKIGEMFRERPRDLLTMDLFAGDGWPELCAFLGKPVPDLPFPNISRRSDVVAPPDAPVVAGSGVISCSESELEKLTGRRTA